MDPVVEETVPRISRLTEEREKEAFRLGWIRVYRPEIFENGWINPTSGFQAYDDEALMKLLDWSE